MHKVKLKGKGILVYDPEDDYLVSHILHHLRHDDTEPLEDDSEAVVVNLCVDGAIYKPEAKDTINSPESLKRLANPPREVLKTHGIVLRETFGVAEALEKKANGASVVVHGYCDEDMLFTDLRFLNRDVTFSEFFESSEEYWITLFRGEVLCVHPLVRSDGSMASNKPRTYSNGWYLGDAVKTSPHHIELGKTLYSAFGIDTLAVRLMETDSGTIANSWRLYSNGKPQTNVLSKRIAKELRRG